MNIELSNNVMVVILTSELISLFLMVRLWKSNDHMLFKYILSALGLRPILGPLIILLNTNWPKPQPHALRNKHKYRTDVFDRWIHVIREKNPKKKFELWRKAIKQNED